jgi:rubrerythrin
MDELPNEVPTHPIDVKATDTLTLFNQNKAVSRALMDLVVEGTEEDREEVLEFRRKRLFKPLWETGDLDRDYVLEKAQEREEDAVEVYEGMIAEINKEEDEEISVPEFILRLQGQDELAEALLDKMAGVDVD